MKLLLITMSALLSLGVISCSNTNTGGSGTQPVSGVTPPRLVGTPKQVNYPGYIAWVYKNGVKMSAKANTLIPIQYQAIDISGDGKIDSVYVKSTAGWQHYHSVGLANQSIPNTIHQQEALAFINEANESRLAASRDVKTLRKKPVTICKQTKKNPAVKTQQSSITKTSPPTPARVSASEHSVGKKVTAKSSKWHDGDPHKITNGSFLE